MHYACTTPASLNVLSFARLYPYVLSSSLQRGPRTQEARQWLLLTNGKPMNFHRELWELSAPKVDVVERARLGIIKGSRTVSQLGLTLRHIVSVYGHSTWSVSCPCVTRPLKYSSASFGQSLFFVCLILNVASSHFVHSFDQFVGQVLALDLVNQWRIWPKCRPRYGSKECPKNIYRSTAFFCRVKK